MNQRAMMSCTGRHHGARTAVSTTAPEAKLATTEEGASIFSHDKQLQTSRHPVLRRGLWPSQSAKRHLPAAAALASCQSFREQVHVMVDEHPQATAAVARKDETGWHWVRQNW